MKTCIKTEAWIAAAQMASGELPEFDEHLAAWFEREYEWPALYVGDEGRLG
jgi:hypothetical protein